MNYRHILICSFFTVLIISGCSNQMKKDKAEKKIPVKVYHVQQESVPEVMQFSGNILPLKTIKFGFMVAGKIKDVYVKEGQYVYEGDLIATIDPVDYEFALQASEAQFIEAKKEFTRLKTLYEKASLTQSNYDKITALYNEAQADYNYKKKQLEDTRLYSPHEGWLAIEGVEPGEIVPQGMPLFAIVYTREVFAQTTIPGNEINAITLNMDLLVKVPAIKDTLFKGKISRIGSVADPYSRSFPVKATVHNHEFILKPGMIAFMNIPTGETMDIICIPAETIVLDSNGKTYVYLVIHGKNKVTKREIQSGNTIGDKVEILDGLNNGDIIVLEGKMKLYEGAPIEISE